MALRSGRRSAHMQNRSSRLLPVFALALASLALPGAIPALLPTAQACGGYGERVPTYEGVVKSINISTGRVVIRYRDHDSQAVTTAAFSSWDRELIAELKPADRVAFGFYPADESGRMHLARIYVLPAPAPAQS